LQRTYSTFLATLAKDTKLKELERTDCENYYYHRHKATNGSVKQVTVQNGQSTINALMKWLHKNGETHIDGFDFKKLPRLDKANPRRTELTEEEKKRLAKLEGIVERLSRGENVQNRQLKTWLSDDEYAELEQAWEEQRELGEELKDKPNDLKRYEEKLRQATFEYNRAEGYSSNGKHATAKKFYNKSESLSEDALEILQEILHYDSSLRIWFDRDISFEVGEGLSADIVSLPRLVTSRSNEKLTEDIRLSSKQSAKLSVVERAIDNIGR